MAVATENLYKVFNKYSTSDLDYCRCGCVDTEDVKKLASKKLRDLEEDDYVAYHDSAISTWGEVDHYKHFLPRILEVYHNLHGRGLIGLYEISIKLEYAKWENWDGKERDAIKDFIFADWIQFANNYESDLGEDDIKSYSKFIDLRELLQAWNIDRNDIAFKNFVIFFYYNGSEIINNDFRINKENRCKDFLNFIDTEKFITKLENEFFKQEEKSDGDYAEKISVVLQMIEPLK